MIQQGDSLNLLKSLPSDSVDALVTDPPYGISFMNKDWDKAVPDIAIWKECLRVMKPGAFAFVMCSPRSDVQAEMVIKLKEAGFEVNFTNLYWIYASGFPKAMNISKAVDRKLGYEREIISGSSKDAQYSGKFDQKSSTERIKLGSPVSEEAKSLDGSYAGFQPKPAVEPILVVMKPLSEKTYVDQALKNGKGITWLDKGRIPYNSEDDMESSRFGVQTDIRGNNYNTNRPSEGHIYNRNVLSSEIGRFPANLLVSDDVLNDGNITQSGGVGGRPMHGRGEGYGFKPMGINAPEVPTDEGSFSRYFDLDTWYEKNVESLPDYVKKVYPFLIVPKASKGEKNKGIEQFDEFTVDDGRHKSIDNPFQRGETLRKNIHPTVKPVKLMSYLVSIATKPNETVLDPFMGSGTTGVACKILNREFIGFEMKGEYFEIAQERIENIPDSIDSYEVDD